MKTRRWFLAGLAVAGGAALLEAQSRAFTRPGFVVVTDFIGRFVAVAESGERVLKVDDRLRAEVTLKTARASTGKVELSNGATLQLGSESELVIEEFWQDPHSLAGKVAEMKEEPSPSRTQLRLVRGDVTAAVKPLKTARGSSFTLDLVVGSIQMTEGSVLARVEMTELGIGVCTLELKAGAAVLELVGGKPAAPLPVGRRLAFAVEVEARTGAVKLSEMPPAPK